MDKRLKLLKENWGKMSELRLIGKPGEEDMNFIAYQDLLLIFDDGELPDDVDAAISKLNSSIRKAHPDFDEIMGIDGTGSEIKHEANMARREYNVDIYSGEIRDNELYIQVDPSEDLGVDIKGSVTLHKIARAIGADRINAEDYTGSMSSVEPKRHVDFPDYALHGTSTEYLKKILAQGIRPPRKKRSNYKHTDVVHDKYIFLTTKAGKANSHAQQAVKTVGGVPIIFKVKIPDKKQIAADYDIDTEHGSTNFHDVRKIKPDRGKKDPQGRSLGKSRDAGVFAYLGAIPKRYIEAIYKGIVDEYGEETPHSIHDFQEMDLMQAMENIQAIEDHYGDINSFFDDMGIDPSVIDDPYFLDEFFADPEEEDDDY